MTDSRADTTGVVVAGGHSTRFGEAEKALAELDGRPMLAHVVGTLGDVADTVVVNCRPDQQAAFDAAVGGLDIDVRWALDEQGGGGPLDGLATALSAVETDFAVVLGCDMPLADAAALLGLLTRVGDSDAAVPRTDAGPEPLHAVYRVRPTRRAARAALDEGERSLRALLDRLTVAYVGGVPARSLISVDTRQRLREIATERG